MGYLIKFTQSGNSYYLATAFKEKFGDIELSLFHEGICYCGTVYERDFKDMSSSAKLEFNAYWELSLSIWINNLVDRKDLEVKYNDSDPNILTFVWKKVLDDCPIKQRLGSVLLIKSNNKGDNLLDYLVTNVNNQRQTIESLREKQIIIMKNYDESLRKLQTLSDIKANVEKQLYSKFVLILNAKKEKIRILEDKLDDKKCGTSRNSDNHRKKSGHTILVTTKKKRKFTPESSDDHDDSVTGSGSGEESLGTDRLEPSGDEDKISNVDTVSTADGSEDYNNQLENENIAISWENEITDCNDVESDDNDEIMIKNEYFSQKVIGEHEGNLRETQEILQKTDDCKDSQVLGSHEEDLDSTQELQDIHSGLERNNETNQSSTCEALNYLDDLI